LRQSGYIQDPTKAWLHDDYPLIEVGELTLNHNTENYFAEVEQATFEPNSFGGPTQDPTYAEHPKQVSTSTVS